MNLAQVTGLAIVMAFGSYAGLQSVEGANAESQKALKMQNHYQLRCLVSNGLKAKTLTSTEFCDVLVEHLGKAIPVKFSLSQTRWQGDGAALFIKVDQHKQFSALVEIGIGRIVENQFLSHETLNLTLNASDAPLSNEMARTLVHPISLALDQAK